MIDCIMPPPSLPPSYLLIKCAIFIIHIILLLIIIPEDLLYLLLNWCFVCRILILIFKRLFTNGRKRGLWSGSIVLRRTVQNIENVSSTLSWTFRFNEYVPKLKWSWNVLGYFGSCFLNCVTKYLQILKYWLRDLIQVQFVSFDR